MNKLQKAHHKLNMKLQEFEEEIPCFYESADLFDPDLYGTPWTAEYKNAAKLAKDLCFMCPAKQECFDYGYKSGATAMVWGGVTPTEMNNMRYRQK